MIVFLLLVIIAIMLLGASRFLGIVAALLGTLVAIAAAGVAMGWIASAFHMDAGDLLMYALFAISPFLILWAALTSMPSVKKAPTIRKPVAPSQFVPSQPLSRDQQRRSDGISAGWNR